MTTPIESLLDTTIRPDSSTAAGSWTELQNAVAARHRRRVLAMRSALAVFLVLLGLAAAMSALGPDVEFVPEVGNVANTPTVAGEWPSSDALVGVSRIRSDAHFWLAWLLGLGLPTLTAAVVWYASPAHLRQPRFAQRAARVVAASAAATLAHVAILSITGTILLFWYDPLADATNQSMLTAVQGIAADWLLAWAILALLAALASLRRLTIWAVVFGPILLVTLFSIANGSGRMLGWTSASPVEASDVPLRGAGRVLIDRERTYLTEGSEIGMGDAWVAVLIYVAVMAFVGWLGWIGLRAVRADSPLSWGRLLPRRIVRHLSRRIAVGIAFLLAGLAFPLLLFGSHWRLGADLANSVPIPPGYSLVSEDHRINLLGDPRAPLARVVLQAPRNIQNPRAPVVAALGPTDYGNERYPLAKARPEGYDATFMRVFEKNFDQVLVELTVLDTDGLAMRWPIVILGGAMVLAGLYLLGLRYERGPPTKSDPIETLDLGADRILAKLLTDQIRDRGFDVRLAENRDGGSADVVSASLPRAQLSVKRSDLEQVIEIIEDLAPGLL